MIGHAWALVGFACLCATCQYASGALPSGGALEAGSWGGPCADGYVEIEPLAVSGEGRLVRFCAEPENLWYYADVEGDGERGTLQVTIPRHPADFRQYDYSACLWTNAELPNHPWPESVGFARTWHASATEDSRTFVFSWSNLESRAAYFGFYGEVNGRPYSEPSACVQKVDRREHLAQTPSMDRLHTKYVKYVLQDGGDPERAVFKIVLPSTDRVPTAHSNGKSSPSESCAKEVNLDHTLSNGRISKICQGSHQHELEFYFSDVRSNAVLILDMPYDYAAPLHNRNEGDLLVLSDTEFLWPVYVSHTSHSYQTIVFEVPQGIKNWQMFYCGWCHGNLEQSQVVVPLPGEQPAAGVPPGEVRCIDGHALMLGPGGDAACVDERSVEILQRRGFEVP